MAEIHIERKRRSPWGWVIALIVLALVAYALYKVFGDEPARQPDNTETTTEPVGMLTDPEQFLFERFLA
jgi:hypothetical protein